MFELYVPNCGVNFNINQGDPGKPSLGDMPGDGTVGEGGGKTKPDKAFHVCPGEVSSLDVNTSQTTSLDQKAVVRIQNNSLACNAYNFQFMIILPDLAHTT